MPCASHRRSAGFGRRLQPPSTPSHPPPPRPRAPAGPPRATRGRRRRPTRRAASRGPSPRSPPTRRRPAPASRSRGPPSRSRSVAVAHRRGVAGAVEQRAVGRAELLARRQQLVGAVLADREVDRARGDARALQGLHGVGVLAPLLAAQALRQRVAGGGELARAAVRRGRRPRRACCERNGAGTRNPWKPVPPSPRSTSTPASASCALRQELGVESFGLNLMLLEPGQRGRVHRHERQEEVYVVLEGTLTLELEGGEMHTLEPRDAARVAPDARRRLSNRGDGRASRCSRSAARTRTRGATASPSPTGTTHEGKPPQEVPLPARPSKPESRPALARMEDLPPERLPHVDHGRAAQEQRGVRRELRQGRAAAAARQEGRRASPAWTRA